MHKISANPAPSWPDNEPDGVDYWLVEVPV